jgi:putative membrane protein
MATFERADTARRASWVTVLGLILVPVLIAAGFVFATWKMGDRLDRVDAAIVNTDEGAEIDGQTVPLGRQLAAGLVDSDSADNISWKLSDSEDAEEGLADGRYAAVVTIPEGFSEAVTSSGDDDPMQARQATLDVKSSASSPLLDSAIAQAVTSAATSQFNAMWSQNYLDQVFVGFTDMGKQMREMGDAADELADGAGELDSGVGELAEGSEELNANSSELTDGFGQMRSGVGDLADGASGLADGARQAGDGASELADGADGLADGAGQLSDGLDLMYNGENGSPGAKDLPDQTKELADGASQVSDGASDLSEGVDAYTQGIDGIVEGLAGDGSGDGGGLGELADGADQVATGARGVSDGLGEYQGQLEDGAAGAGQLAQNPGSTSLSGLAQQGILTSEQASALQSQLDEVCAADDSGQLCAQLEPLLVASAASGAATGLGTGAAGLDRVDPATGMSLKDAAAGTADGAEGVADGAQQAADGFTELEEQAPELLEASQGLRDGASGLADGTGELADGTGQLADGMGPLADGIRDAGSGASDLADGAGQLSDGAGELAEGMTPLADGATQLADGAGELDSGMGEFEDGLGQYTDGVSQLAQGVDQLSEGTGQLADGTQEFSDGIAEGADEVPSYSAQERDNLSEVVAEPVAGDGEGFSGLAQNSTIAMLVIMAMWIGALVTYTVLRAVPARALTSRTSSWAILGRGMVPGLLVGAVQAVVLTVLAVAVLDIPLFELGPLVCLLLFAALVFTLVNFALTAWLGGFGRILSVAAVVAAVAGRLFSATPAWFDALAPLLPLTPAMNGMTALAAGTPGLGAAFGGLLGWGVLGVIGAITAVVRSRVAGSAGLARLSRSGA